MGKRREARPTRITCAMSITSCSVGGSHGGLTPCCSFILEDESSKILKNRDTLQPGVVSRESLTILETRKRA